MMDITKADKMKIEFRVMLWYLKRHLKKNYKITLDEIEHDLENCGNPVIAEIWDVIKNGSDKIKEEYQKEIVTEFPMALLWILYRDTAYLPITMYLLKDILDRKDRMYPNVLKYYKEPQDWYVNAWHDSKEHTAQMVKDEKIPKVEGIMSPDESIFVPTYQKKIHDEIVANMEKELDMKKKDKNYGR